MQVKNIIIALLLLSVCGLGVASAGITHIPAGNIETTTLSTADEVYVLDGDVNSGGRAFAFGAANVTLDGNGHTVIYGNDTDNGVLINAVTNATLKNVRLVTTSPSNNAAGIYLRANNATIENVTFITPAAPAINAASIDSCTFSNLKIDVPDYSALELYTLSNCVFKNISSTSENSGALTLANSNDNIVQDSMFESGASTGVRLFGSTFTGNVFRNVTMSSNVGSGMYFVTDCTDNTFEDINALSNTSFGLFMSAGCNNNTFNSAYMHSNTSYGAFLNDSLAGNQFNDCTFSSGLDHGFMFGNVSYLNSYSNITVTSPRNEDYTSSTHPKIRVMMLGDSITENFDSTGALSKYLIPELGSNYEVVNRGLHAERSTGGRARIENELAIYHPDVVTLAYGINDLGIDLRPEQDIIDNMLWMANKSVEYGASPIIVLTVPAQTANVTSYETNLESQSTALGFHVMNSFDMIDSNPGNGLWDNYVADYYFDALHPNDDGYALLGPGYASYIKAHFNIPNVNGNRVVEGSYNGIVTTWGSIVGFMSIIAFLAFAGIAWAFMNRKISLGVGMEFLTMGGALVVIAGLITYMLYIILNMGA